MSQLPGSDNNLAERHEEPSETQKLLASSLASKVRSIEDVVNIGASCYYPMEERAHEELKYIDPIHTQGLLGLGLVDLSALKAAKLGVGVAAIPANILEKMVIRTQESIP